MLIVIYFKLLLNLTPKDEIITFIFVFIKNFIFIYISI